ncbi:hypothetical protein [Sorangium sp. So ce1389]|uniref:hypothetical protein n=1 Tax=Sorangium sp. So ce1389 TaxID=3133336 RepID=UPI003F5DD626
MAIVFDEVVGTVEPGQEPAEPPAGDGEQAAGADRGGVDEAGLAAWLRRRAWLLERRRAD